MQEQPEQYKIYIQEGAILNKRQKRAYTASNIKPDKKNQQTQSQALGCMCDNFYDIRMFGTVMSTGDYVAGQVRGTVQMAITHCAGTKENENRENKTMGLKAILPNKILKPYSTNQVAVRFWGS